MEKYLLMIYTIKIIISKTQNGYSQYKKNSIKKDREPE